MLINILHLSRNTTEKYRQNSRVCLFPGASLSHMFHSTYSIHMFLFYIVRRRRACQYSVQLNSPYRNYLIYQIIWNKDFFLRNQSTLSLRFKPLSDCLLLSCCAPV